MTRLINLDSLIPDDITVIKDGREWRIPGDLPVHTVLRLIKAGQVLNMASTPEAQADALNDIAIVIRDLFAINHQEAKVLRFGAREVSILLGQLLSLLNNDPNPNVMRPPGTKAQKRAVRK